MDGDACVLGIETSCDETAAAIVRSGVEILSNIVASQVDLHRRYGGVVPEVASRQHLIAIVPVVEQALAAAGLAWGDLSGLGVTYGPGLAGSLLVGVNMAKALSLAQGLPMVGVNHLEGHIYANWAAGPVPGAAGGDPNPTGWNLPPVEFPLLCLIVSGGHSDLLLMRDHGDYRLLGRTIDDAAGEAFDKVARILGLGYPGGPAIQQAAEKGNPRAFAVPRAWLKGTLDFSFSGIKTAMLRLVEERRALSGGNLTPSVQADLAASFQAAVVDMLVEKTRLATGQYEARQVLLGGGVAANAQLRQEMTRRLPLPVFYPPISLCTDNAVGTAAAGYYRLRRGLASGLDLDVLPSLRWG
jgi:N6-L-threonylcarbamoyladenine synthase